MLAIILILLGAGIGLWLGQIGWELGAVLMGGLVGALLAFQVRLQARLARLQARPERSGRPAAGDPARAGSRAPPAAPPAPPPAPARRPEPPVPGKPASAKAGAARSRDPWAEPVRRGVAWLSSGNVPAKIGVLLCFLGVAFLFSYAAEQGWLGMPVEWRLGLVAAGGMAMLLVGWKLRARRRLYGLTLQGGGVGILYLTIFFALRVFEVAPAVPALAGMALIALGAGALAALQHAPVLAILGSVGGFLAPVLAGGEADSAVPLFAWFAVLNLGIAGLAWSRNWRSLTLTGFAFTFGLGGLWGWRFYGPDHLLEVQPFLVGFFALYALLPLIHVLRDRRARAAVDGGLLFGTPVLFLAYQVTLLEGDGMSLAFASLGAGALYLGLALTARRLTAVALLQQSYTVLALSLATLAVPLALDGRWTAGLWALEGAALVWIGLRQRQWFMRLAGCALPLAAGTAMLADPGPAGGMVIVNGRTLSAVMVAASALLGAGLLHHGRDRLRFGFEPALGVVLLLWGIAWWYATGLMEIERSVAGGLMHPAFAAFTGMSAMGAGWLVRRTGWTGPGWVLPATGFVLLALSALGGVDAGSGWHWALWMIALSAVPVGLRLAEPVPDRGRALAHAAWMWALGLVLALAVHDAVAAVPNLARTWHDCAGLVVGAALLIGLATRLRTVRWPVRAWPTAYAGPGVIPVTLVLAWLILSLNARSPGDSEPLAYLPLLNPLDMASALALAGLWLSLERLHAPPAREDVIVMARLALGGLALFWLTAATVRATHQYGGVAWEGRALFESVAVQSAVSLVWCLAGLALAVYGTRRGLRPAWIAGASLLGAVVLKLFVVDLGGTGTLARVISFVGVGVLLLAVGYLAPVPPSAASRQETP